MSDLLAERQARVYAEWDSQRGKLPGRAVPEWIGKTPDTKIPDAVRLRVLRMWDHTCYLTGIKITTETPHMEHVIPLHLGGENRESNIRPALAPGHAVKSAAEQKAKAKADAAARRKVGLVASKGPPLQSAPFPKAPPQQRASKPPAKPCAGQPALMRRFTNG